MFPFSILDQDVDARLDHDGSDAYDLNLARIRAVNAAQLQLMTAIHAGLDERKMSAESLRDLSRVMVFQTSHAGQVAIDDLLALANNGEKLWSIVAVHPKFNSYGPQVIVGDPLPTNSLLRTDIRYYEPVKSAKRYTQEQLAQAKGDIFAPGNTEIPETDPKCEYGYSVEPRSFTSTGQVVGTTVKVFPHTFGTRKLVAIGYLKEPALVPTMPLYGNDPLYTSTQMEWPISCKELLVAVTLRILSIKTGDSTTQYVLSKEEEAQLIRLML